jgi:acyl transferase domain-containing protein
VIYREEATAGEGPDGLDQTFIAQPALFVVEYALARLWMEWGVRPEAMLGHSVGEYVAACLAGVMSLEDALALVAARGRLMQQLPCGAMLAVPLPEGEARALFGDDRSLSLAAVNAPSLCVVSGPEEAVGRLAARCSEDGVQTRRLHTSHAFHSAMMEPMLDEFLRHVRRVRLRPPQIPYLSNVTGGWITDAEATTPDYWAAHLRQTVRFSEGVAELAKNPARVFLEVGPGRTLGNSVRQTRTRGAAPTVISTLPHPREQESDTASALGALGKLWLAGAKVDWEGFNADKRRRVPLPTYPFERRRYWVDRAQHADGRREGPADKKPDAAGRFYAPVWTQSPRRTLPAAAAGETPSALVLTDEGGLGAALAQRLTELGGDVVTVGIGGGFEKVGGSAYVISPGRPGDYDLLLEELESRGEAPRRIVHLWSVSPDAEDERAAAEFSEAYQARGYYSLLLLAQALGRRDRGRPLAIEVVTNNLHSVTGGEVLCPQKATILGACRAVPQELPQVSCRGIDVTFAEPRGRGVGDVVEQLLGEFAAGEAEALVAYRGGRRWVRRFEPVRLEPQAPPGAGLREGGVYLITGGLRGIGLALAEHLARTKGAKLILTESANFPPREEWDSWPEAHGEQHEVSLKIRKLRALEEAGGRVLVVAGSASTPEAARAAIAEARARFGEINGVIHTGLDSDPAFIQRRAAAVGADALSRNVAETLLLESLLKEVRLDFLALFSSASSITGAPGQVDKCATGAFLDAFAHYRSLADGRATLAVDWDAPRWEEMPESLLPIVPELGTHLRQLRERHGLSLEDGVDAFERLVASGLTQAVVSTRSFAPAPEEPDALDRARLSEELKRHAAPEPADARGGLESGYAAPSSEVEKRIAEAWQEVLGVERVGVHDKFFELGGNSLLGIQLVSRLRKVFLLELPMTILFESQTVAEQASVVSETQRQEQEMEELERMLKEIEGLSAEDLDSRLAAVDELSGEGVR